MVTRIPKELLKSGTGYTVFGSEDTTDVVEIPRTKISDADQFFIMENNAVDADHDLDINPAVGVTDDREGVIALDSVLTKQIDATWTQGSNQGGLDTGTVAADTWYHVHLIENTSDFTVDALFSVSKDSPTVPAGWERKKRIGSILTDAIGNILGFRQIGSEFFFNPHQLNYQTSASGLNDITQNVTMSIPDDVLVRLIMTFAARVPDSSSYLHSIRPAGDPEHSTAVASAMGEITAVSGDLAGPSGTIYGDSYMDSYQKLLMDNNDTITFHFSNQTNLNNASINTLTVYTIGWEDMEL